MEKETCPHQKECTYEKWCTLKDVPEYCAIAKEKVLGVTEDDVDNKLQAE
jgi:hypothetical protein